ncbi:MAG: hypothetical protein P8049_03610, partial [Gemmatimonadota bacterium]
MSARFRETWRDAIRAVDRRPGDSWRDRWAHHGSRGLLVVLFAALLPFLFPRSPLPEAVSLSAGAIADQDVIAAFEFTVPKPPAQLALERAEAERVVAPVYSLDAQAADSARSLASGFFSALDSAVAVSGREGVDGVADAFGFRINPEQAAFLVDAGRRNSLRASLDRAYAELLPRGVAPILDVTDPAPSVVLLRTPDGDRRIPRDSLRTVGGFLDEALAFAPTDLSLAGFQLYQNLLFRFTVPSLRFDSGESEAARMQARTAVDTVLGTVLEGERIVSAHERVSERELVRLRAYNAALSERGLASQESRRRTAVGSYLFGVLMLGLFAVVLVLYRPVIYRNARPRTACGPEPPSSRSRCFATETIMPDHKNQPRRSHSVTVATGRVSAAGLGPRLLLALVILPIASVAISACSGSAPPIDPTVGKNPDLPPPATSLLPTVNIAPAIGWPGRWRSTRGLPPQSRRIDRVKASPYP